MHTSLNYYLFVLVIIAVVGWFAAGTQFNVRKGHKVLAWLQQGLKTLGEKTSLRWLGSSVVELKIPNANVPFRTAELMVVLEPRDVALLWWFHHARGRRDLLIFRGNLRRTPGFEFEALDPKGWSARGLEQQVRFRNWNNVTVPGPSNLVAYAAGETPSAAELIAIATPPDCPVQRLAIRRTEPNLEIHWRLADAQKVSAQTLLGTIQNLPKSLAVHR